MIGKTIHHYKILEELGSGGMGTVYKAKDTKLDRSVALKFLAPHLSRDENEKERFIREAKAISALDHPNICSIFEINETDDGQLYIAMACYQGKSLQDIIKERHLPVERVVDIAVQIAEGLSAAHSKNIIHRDIKPANILLTEEGKVKIVDFGLARLVGKTMLTKEGTTLGTTAYMSPEQIKGAEVDNRTDIWAFGIVLYEMLTGGLPFKGEYDQAIIYSILNEEINLDVEGLNNNKKLKELIKKCLQKDKTKRFQSFEETLIELKSTQNDFIAPVSTQSIKNIIRKKEFLVPTFFVLAIITFFTIRFTQNRNEEHYARFEILPRIQKLVHESLWTGERYNAWQAFNLANKIQQIIPEDPVLESLYKKITRKVSINSMQKSIKVSIKPYSSSSQWKVLGRTPIESVYIPVGYSQLKFEKKGFATAYDLIWINSLHKDYSITFKLVAIDKKPDGMVFVPNEATWIDGSSANSNLHLPGLEQVNFISVGDFFMDRFEVSNRQYKEFVDVGGYKNPAYWKYPFNLNGKKLSWKEAMKHFVDKTDRPGPSTWEVSDYPEGEGDLPVSGISWYEAAAYAKFKGKSLPTIYHWDRVAFISASPVIIPKSNLGSNRPISVEDSNSINRFGVYNLAGNVREWCFNSEMKSDNFILGGGWNDPGYAFNDFYLQSPFDRSKTNGFRCIKYIQKDNKDLLEGMIKLPRRDYINNKPVSDERFNLILNEYAYDKRPLEADLDEQKEFKEYIRQKISFNAAYGEERMFGYLFIPKNIQPPYQTVIYFPGSHAINIQSSMNLTLNNFIDFYVKSGRALFYPIYKSTYERGDEVHTDVPDASNRYKEHVIMWTNDVRRSIDYLESRKDINSDKIAYYGYSWGGYMGGIIPAVEKRIRAVILVVAGLDYVNPLPEAKTANFLSRIMQPVLMLNGKYDFYFPYEKSQKPFFDFLGTKDKKMKVYDGGHTVPYAELARESLIWLDKYLGKVESD